MFEIASLEVSPYLGLDGSVDESSDDGVLSFYFFQNFVMDFIKESREGSENSWFQSLNIVKEVVNVATAEPDFEAEHQRISQHDLLVNVGEGHVRQVDVLLFKVESQEVFAYLARDKVQMS